MPIIQRLRRGETARFGLFVRDDVGSLGKCRGVLLPLFPLYGGWYDINRDNVNRGWRLMSLMLWFNDGYRYGALDIRIGWGGKPFGKQRLIKGWSY